MTGRFVRQSLLAASVILIGANIGGRFLGFLREALIADLFGTSTRFDTFILAFTIPELLTFVIFAALPTAIIPSLARSLANKDSDQSGLFWKGLFFFAGLFATLAIFIFIGRSGILDLLAPSLGPSQKELGVNLIAIFSLFVFFRGMEAYFRGWLFQQKHFIVPALSPFIINTVVISALLILHSQLDIKALAYGWLASSALLFAFNGFFALRVVKPGLPGIAKSISIKPLLKLTMVVALIEALTLLYPAVDRYLAVMFLSEGQIAALRYAVILSNLAPVILVVTFSIASFPWIAELVAASDTKRLVRLYQESIRSILFALAPIAAVMAWFGFDIIKIVFHHGAFDTNSLLLTVGPFKYYALGILFYSVFYFQTRFYYARQATLRLGLILSLVFGVKIVLSILLIGPMQQNGLALATSLAWMVAAIILTLDLSLRAKLSPGLRFREIAGIIFALGACLLSLATLDLLWSGESYGVVASILRLAVIIGSGMTVYLLVAFLFNLPEPNKLWQAVRSNLLKNGPDQV